MKKYIHILACFSTAALLLSGCSTGTFKKSSNTNAAVPQMSTSSPSPNHRGGAIISLIRIKVRNTSGLDTYKMMYWSDNIPTEAFLAVPQIEDGTYPLLVSCHGGFLLATDISHASSPEGVSNLAGANSSMITLVPEYRGYDGSSGTVHGLYGDTLDTNNAIKAVMSRFSVEPKHIYLSGASMGGGVVLRLAAERQDVRSVIALSPWVGMQVAGTWAVKNKNSNDMAFNIYGDMLMYGTNNPNSPKLAKESVDYKKIHVPVLLLQGTGDSHVAWQTVQAFYDDLKQPDKLTKLILFPGGHHGLHGRNQEAVNKDVQNWYNLYGEYSSFEQ